MARKTSKKVSKKRLSHKKWLFVIVIVIIALGCGVTWWFMFSQSKPAAKKITIASLNKSVSNAQKLVNNGDSNAAKTAYDEIIKTTDDSHTKVILLLDKALIPFNKGSYDEALIIAKTAESLEKSSYVYSFIAQIYEKQGDNSNSAKYYQLAISLIDKKQPSASEDIDYYQSKVNLLNGVKK